MKKNLELILLIINWVIVAIQAFTIFLYGNSIGLFIIMLLALIAQVFSVYDNKKNVNEGNKFENIISIGRAINQEIKISNDEAKVVELFNRLNGIKSSLVALFNIWATSSTICFFV